MGFLICLLGGDPRQLLAFTAVYLDSLPRGPGLLGLCSVCSLQLRMSEPRVLWKETSKVNTHSYGGIVTLDVDLKNIHNLKVEKYVLFNGNF